MITQRVGLLAIRSGATYRATAGAVAGVAEDPVAGLAEDPVAGLVEDPVAGLAEDPVAGLAEDPGGGVARGWSALLLLLGARRNAVPVTGLTSVNEFSVAVVFWM